MKSLAFYGIFVLAFLGCLIKPAKLSSANLTSVKDTLQSSRLSFNGRVDSTGTTAGSSNVKIKTVASAPANSVSTAGLKVGDSLVIGTGTYTIVGITDADEFTVSPVLASGDADDNDVVYLKMKPRHVVTFVTATAVANGSFRILLPADATTPNDGAPDDGGFDFNTTVTVTASNVTGYTFAAGTSTVYGGTNCTAPTNYHCFDIGYTGSGAVGTTITINIGNTSGATTPIAPVPTSSHAEGTADTYSFIVRNYASGADPDADAPIDSTTGKIAFIEGVRITATIDPSISFSIAGVASSQTRCGVSTDISTSTGVNAPLAVPFGTMTLNTFKNAAHDLTVSTNASSGYVVTAAENDQLGKGGGATPFIPDAPGNGNLASESTSDEWTTATQNGFGYSIQNVDASSTSFLYTTATGNCTGTFCARQFADLTGSETPQTIFSSSTIANAENVYVCYRLSVGATQAAGDYENQITYTATGTF